MQQREFLMSGKNLASKHKIAGYYMSEKLGGGRAFWDGGLSRGIPTTSVPWANVTDPKTGQPRRDIKPIASGLWSRHANPITAPDWFLNTLPCCPLDGELWAGRGGFQQVVATIRSDKPVDQLWKGIQYGVFGTPNIWAVMQDGEIRNNHLYRTINKREIETWIKNRDRDILENYRFLEGNPAFSNELASLNDWINMASDTHFLIRHVKLPDIEGMAREIVAAGKREVLAKGGEGLSLRCPHSTWQPHKVETSLNFRKRP